MLVYSDATDFDFKARKLRTMLEQGNVGEAMILLKAIFSEVPYHINGCRKSFYQAVMHSICSTAGINVCSEYAIAQGPVDMVMRFSRLIYIIEINYNKPAAAALQRIEKGRYYEAFTLRKVPIMLLGMSFTRARKKFEIAYVSKRWFEEKKF